jgi:hypothetical protein
MIYAHGFCDGNLVHAIAEYHKRFPNRTTRAISPLISTRAVYLCTSVNTAIYMPTVSLNYKILQ